MSTYACHGILLLGVQTIDYEKENKSETFQVRGYQGANFMSLPCHIFINQNALCCSLITLSLSLKVPCQLGSHECSFFVMQFVNDIIENYTLLTSKEVRNEFKKLHINRCLCDKKKI